MMKRREFLSFAGAMGVIGTCGSSFAQENKSSQVGQLLITGFRGTSISDPEVEQVRRYIEGGQVAGVLLLERNIESPEQLHRLTSALQSTAPDNPIIISVDQEGGSVARLGKNNGFSDWISAANLATSGRNNREILEYYTERASELRATGINLNFGPVVDLNVNPYNPIIGSKGRSFGRQVEEVVRFAELFVLAHRSAGVKTCLKHFPGHGSSFEDSHYETADVTETWKAEEISPFERLIRADLADSVMNAHVIHKFLSDGPNLPTSLSRNTSDELREGLLFHGPIFTDDMQMKSITNVMSAIDASVLSVLAGNTFLIYSNYLRQHTVQTISAVHHALKTALVDRVIDQSTIADRIAVAKTFRESITHLA